MFNKEYNKLCKIDTNYHSIYDEILILNNIDISNFKQDKIDKPFQKYSENIIKNNEEKMLNIYYNETSIDYLKRIYGSDIIKEYKYIHINNYIYKKCVDCDYNLDNKYKYDRCSECYIYYRRDKEIFNILLSKVKYIKNILNKNIYLYKKLYDMYIKNEIKIECINYKTFEHKIIKLKKINK